MDGLSTFLKRVGGALMIKFKTCLVVLIGALSFSAFADNEKLVPCKNFNSLSQVIEQIKSLDQTFQWSSPNCKIVATKSIFPKKEKDGTTQFERGIQLLIYQNNELKFVCLPGWVCKSW